MSDFDAEDSSRSVLSKADEFLRRRRAQQGIPVEDMELAKSFEPAEIERRWYPEWESRGYFAAGLDTHQTSPISASCCRRPTSPARCTWVMASTRP
jgi:hypothetical protein